MIFADLFYNLRTAGLKVGTGEWLSLMQAMNEGLIKPSLSDFYQIARALLIKNENQFDIYDQVFVATFADGALPEAEIEKFLQWLADKKMPQLDEAMITALQALPLDELRRRFEERLTKQKERHDGGSYFIGTGGTSPFGHGGKNPAGVLMGGEGGSRSAVQVAMERRFRDYRDDRVLDVRAMQVALKKLRRLSHQEGILELDVDASIDKTSRNAGELELQFSPPRKNDVRVLLLLDTGGSMDPYSELVEQLFSAATHIHHFKHFEALSFHNCVYEKLYTKIAEEKTIPTADILIRHPHDTYMILVGDAFMAPSELTDRYGAIQYSHHNTTPGLEWLRKIKNRFYRSIWLNPMPLRSWSQSWTIKTISSVFPMFELSVRGIEEAVDHLRKMPRRQESGT